MQHTLSINYQSPTGTKSAQIVSTGTANIEMDLPIAANASAAETDLTIISANLLSFALFATAAMTVVFKTGTGGSGTTEATFTVSPTQPFAWAVGDGSNPFGGSVGQMLVTSVPGGTLSVRALLND